MIKVIDEKQILSIIEERKEKEEYTIIHIYDYNRRNRIFNVDINPYDNNRVEYFDMVLEEEKPCEKICNDIKESYHDQIQINSIRDCIYGDISVEFKIKKVRVIITYYSPEGYEYLKEIYNEQHPKKRI